MPRDMIAYMNARKAAKAATGGAKQNQTVKYCPDNQLDCWELLEHKVESAWSDLRINSQAYWDKVFAQFGLVQGYDLEESF